MPLKLLILDSEPCHQECYDSLPKRGHKLFFSNSTKDAEANMKSALEEKKPYQMLIVNEIEFPEPEALISDFREYFPNRPVLVATESREPIRIMRRVRQGLDLIFPPFDSDQMMEKVNDSNQWVREQKEKEDAVKANEKIIPFVNSVEMKLTLDNDIDNVPHTIQYILKFLESNQIGEDDLFRVKLGLSELLINAMAHGNLELSSQEIKGDEKDFARWNEELKRRSLLDQYRDRKVRVTVTCQPSQMVELFIEDEGEGFDHRAFLAKPESDEAFAAYGRGIQMVQAMAEKLEYNELGNAVTLLYQVRT